MTKQTVAIGGMTCAACAKRIEKIVGKLKGVAIASVNFAAEKLSVEYDEKLVTFNNIEKKIADAGFNVIKKTAKSAAVDEDKLRKEKEIRALKMKFTISALFCLPLLYLAMVPMITWLQAWHPYPATLDPIEPREPTR